MRNDFDESPADDDLTRDFWGEPKGRKAGTPPAGVGRRNMSAGTNASPLGSQPSGRPTSASEAIEAVKDSWKAFKPHGSDRTGAMPRTRQHGAVDPNRPLTPPRGSQRPAQQSPAAPRRKRVAQNELSISDLGSGRAADLSLDAWDSIDDWSELDNLTARHQAQKASREYRDQVRRDNAAARSSSSTPTGPRSAGVRPSSHATTAAGAPHEPVSNPVLAGAPFVDAGDDGYHDYEDAYQVPLATQLAEKMGWRGADPLLVKGLGAVFLTLFLLPFFFAGRGGSEPEQATEALPTPSALANDGSVTPTTLSAVPVEDDKETTITVSVEPEVGAASGSSKSDNSSGGESSSESASSKSSSSSSGSSSSGSSSKSSSSKSSSSKSSGDSSSSGSSGNSSKGSSSSTKQAETSTKDTTAPKSCDNSYEAGAGDSWYGIADKAGVSPSKLLDANNATAETVILPGRTICLPAGAQTPTAATTTTTTAPSSNDDDDDGDTGATTTTAATVTTTKAPSTTTTTKAPTTTTTTAAPTNTGSPGKNASPEQVKQVIRDVFPADLEAKALDIAYRESRYSPTANNGWCCHGVFQIYYKYHTSWLPSIGVNSVEDLYDPVLNAKAALELYRRAGNSWSPWTTA